MRSPEPGNSRALSAVVAVGLATVFLFSFLPYVALVLGSVLPNHLLDRGIILEWPLRHTWENYVELWQDWGKYGRYIFNTFKVSIPTAFIVLFLSVMGAFGLTRYKFRWRELVRQMAFWGYIFPPVVLVFPHSEILGRLGLNGTIFGLIVVNVAFCFPFGLWLMIQYLEAVPLDYDRAAYADGARWWQLLWHVLVRRALPGVLAVWMFSFILSWNDVVLALVLAEDDNLTIAAGISDKILANSADMSRHGTFAAASLIVATAAIGLFGGMQWWIDRQQRAEVSEND